MLEPCPLGSSLQAVWDVLDADVYGRARGYVGWVHEKCGRKCGSGGNDVRNVWHGNFSVVWLNKAELLRALHVNHPTGNQIGKGKEMTKENECE